MNEQRLPTVLAPDSPIIDKLKLQLRNNLRNIEKLRGDINNINNEINLLKIEAYNEIYQTLKPKSQNNIVSSQKRDPCSIIINSYNNKITLLEEYINENEKKMNDIIIKNNNIESNIRQIQSQRQPRRQIQPQQRQRQPQQRQRQPQQRQRQPQRGELLAPATPTPKRNRITGGKSKKAMSKPTKSKKKN
jgi:hypothetical protein